MLGATAVGLQLVEFGASYNNIFRPHTTVWFVLLGWAGHVAVTNRQRLLVTAVLVGGTPLYFDRWQQALMVTVLVGALLWLPTVRVPRLAAPVFGVVAAASMVTFLTHWQVWPIYTNVFVREAAFLLTLATGVAVWAIGRRVMRTGVVHAAESTHSSSTGLSRRVVAGPDNMWGMTSTPAYDWVAHHAMVSPNRAAWADIDPLSGSPGVASTWREAHDRVGRAAAMLRDDFGVGRGDRVAVYSQNRVEFIEVQFACARLGAVFVPLNWRLTIHELDYIVSDASPTVLVADPELGDMAAELVERTNTPHLIVFSGDGAHPDRSANYDDGLAAVDTTTLPVMPELTHDDPLTIMYTSGTTGRPKGAIITHGMSFWNSVNLAELHDLSRSMVNFCFLPLFHTGGLNCYTNPAAYFGGSTMVMRTFDPGRALELISDPERGITHFLGVPANYLFMGQHPDFASTDFSRLVSTAIGGAPAALPLLKMWESVGCPLIQAFGMTETSPLVLSISKEMAVEKAGSAGLPAMNTAIRIVGEDGVDVGVGEIGELWCKGPNITPGYWNNPEATAEAITDGWLHTGDAAQADADGYVSIVDRWKDMYISGGENVYPSEVESTLFDLEGIADVAVIGLPDDKWGEVGQAVVVKTDGVEIDETTIVNFCRERLATFKVPHSVRFVDELPRNATGKILKRELRDQ